MSGRLSTGLCVVHIKRIHSRCLSCNNHRRNLKLCYLFLPLSRFRFHRNHNQSVHPVAPHHIQTFLLMIPIITRIKKNHTIPSLSCCLLNMFDQICKKCISNICNYHTDQMGLTSHQALGHNVWLKLMFPGTCQHSFPDLRIYCFITIQYTGYGRL